MNEVWVVLVSGRARAAFEYEFDATSLADELRGNGDEVVVQTVPFTESSDQAGAVVTRDPHKESGMTVEQWAAYLIQQGTPVKWASDKERSLAFSNGTVYVMTWFTPLGNHYYAAASEASLREFTGYPKEAPGVVV